MKKFFFKFAVFSLSLFLAIGFVGKHSRVEAAIDRIKAEVQMWQEANNDTGRCYGPTFKAGVPIHVEIFDIYFKGEHITAPPQTQPIKGTTFYYQKGRWDTYPAESHIRDIEAGTGIIRKDITYTITDEDRYLKINYNMGGFFNATRTLEKKDFEVVPADEVDEEKCFKTPPEDFSLCEQIPASKPNEPDLIDRCRKCFAAGGIWTAIGCIPSDPESIISTIIKIGLILGGAIVLVMILVGAFMLSTSRGDPKKTQEAKELITSAIVGLLFIIFSVTILQFIGVSVIRIPGFGQP